MSNLAEIVVPDIGDFTDVDVIEVLVKKGDKVNPEDGLITLETDKATIEIPTTVAGTVESVLVTVGDKVTEGHPIAVLLEEKAVAEDITPSPEEISAVAVDTPPPVTASKPVSSPRPVSGELPPIDEAGFAKAHASPSVRKLARELGVDLIQVKGTGQKLRILHEDVKGFVKAILTGKFSPSGMSLPQVPKVDFSKFGEIDVQPLSRIQKISGPRLQASWINLPHVTQHDLADITDLETKRSELKGPAKERGISLTPLAFVIKACIRALKEYPKVNASLSGDGESVVYKQYWHIGFAADTEHGLMVPVIRDADKLSLHELATELGLLSMAARNGTLKGEQLQGASFTVSSLGGIGGTGFTPIVNAPEAAILGVARSSMQPVWNGSEFEPRLMLPVALSYDHRLIDGAYAVRFTTFLCEQLANVEKLTKATP